MLILILLGGLIAYLGDKIGMQVGKRRLSLFGLRPKYTSIVVTIGTGLLIVAASITVLSIASNDVRDALFRMREIQATLASNQAKLAELESELTLQQEELERTVQQRDEATRELSQAAQRLEEVEAEYRRVEAELTAARAEVEFQRRRIVNLQDVSEELLQRIQEMQETVVDLKEQIDILAREQMRMRQGEVAFRADEIILATVIQGGRPADELRRQLAAFLEEVDRVGRARGAVRIPNDDARAFVLPDEGVFARAVETLSQGPYRWVVRAIAFENTLIGEPVRVNFELIREQLIYREGDVIAERNVHLLSGETAGDEILALLAQVRDRAIQEGMITSEEGDVGQLISADEFLDAIRRLQDMGGRGRVMAIAARDTWNTEGPLLVRLRVEPL